ncbi:putative alpha-1A adrenergic receptor-like [Apostichopus japonicus]|uniref:Putative alpha-1A adrenergic receptor-like n=1 Tax=Stichopus japonicus TaxID=307972 RepID=A0A2G8KJE3_STIJA|nr:putative alpha-1A adrenergic receptor-like [Apostichopus japonicus]
MEGDIFIAVILTINVTISLVGVLGNGVIITAFITKRRLRTQSNYFMISLLILSFIHCAVFYPIQALVDIGIIVGQAACLPIGCVGITESVAITMCLLATSTERYIAICWPLTADSILTPNRIVVTFVVIAAYSITSGIIFPSLTWIGYEGGAFEDKYSRCTLVSISPTVGFSVWMCVNWLAPIPIMFMIYCRIFMIVRRHAREINALKPQFNLIATNMVQLHEIPRGRNKIHPNGHFEKTADVNDPYNTGDQITVVNGENLRKHSPILENHMREPQILQNGNGSQDPRTGSGENLQQIEREVTGQNWT